MKQIFFSRIKIITNIHGAIRFTMLSGSCLKLLKMDSTGFTTIRLKIKFWNFKAIYKF